MLENQHITDATLVSNYQAGDSKALAELVRRWHKRFCEKAFWVVKDADLAKDVAQESWRTIMTKMGSINDPKSFGSWASRIVYTKSMDVLRLNSRTQSTKKEYAKEHQVVEAEMEDNQELKNRLLAAVNDLPINQKKVIRLFYVEDYTLKEIAELLEISVGTAKSRLFHAREKIKITLKNRNYGN